MTRLSPTEATSELAAQHEQTGHFPLELRGAGAILVGGTTTQSGLLLPAKYGNTTDSHPDHSALGNVYRDTSSSEMHWLNEKIWENLSGKSRFTVEELIISISERFSLPPTDFDIYHEKPDHPVGSVAVAYAANIGVFVGSWNEIMSKPSSPDDTAIDYIVEAGGTSYDTRSGMTTSVYKQMAKMKRLNQIHDAQFEHGLVLENVHDPRSKLVYRHAYTLLTGDRINADGDATYGSVSEGKIGLSPITTSYNGNEVRFRPAVIVPRTE